MNDIINDSLNEEDFVFTQSIDKETGDTVIMGGGYKVDSFFLKQGIPVMKQNADSFGEGHEQSGGKVSSPFESLAVPAGLFYINQKVPKIPYGNSPIHFKQQSFVSDDLLDKLYALVSADKATNKATDKTNATNKKGTRRKSGNKASNKKTRRQNRGH
jgi:hypothetical protein